MSSDTETKSDSINISDFPDDFQESLTLLDFDGDGKLSSQEIALAAKLYVAAKEETKVQSKQIYLLLIGYVVLAGTIGGMVYAIMVLSRQVEVDPMTGLATVSSTGDIMKTSNALFHIFNASIVDMSGTELSKMNSIKFNNDDTSFLVKGHAKRSNDTVVLVEGGRFIFGSDGFHDVIGDDIINMMLNVNDDELGIYDDNELVSYDDDNINNGTRRELLPRYPNSRSDVQRKLHDGGEAHCRNRKGDISTRHVSRGCEGSTQNVAVVAVSPPAPTFVFYTQCNGKDKRMDEWPCCEDGSEKNNDGSMRECCKCQ